MLDLALTTLLSPVVLFFILGLLAALLRSSMSIPEAFAKGLAIYLMMAIGLKGGIAMSESPVTLAMIGVFAIAIALSFSLPAIAYGALRVTSKLSRIDAAATAAHYGSISIVTFVAATQLLASANIESSGYMVAVAAAMEAPAIITALFLASRGKQKSEPVAGSESGELFREVLLNASVVVLVGALIIGALIGTDGAKQISPFFVDPFQGVLCLFLLDMGLSAGRGLRHGWRQLDAAALGFGIYMPLISASLAAIASILLGLDTGDTTLLMVLSASASYIAVPAAMRLALPEAKPSIYLTLSLGITFPFNIAVGIPLYLTVAQWLQGGA
ncbi:sodium-dependent bicarbonate transport family permease [Henriciella barbarensis]|uniref:Sodium-dependent bicarbonate transport family permease n=1 Tax=Henriciella barbarensis TaxID=86342 RepID=A0A399QZP0_9PROT|nr:sodium-dependent bicarbonate transport family permease [Henriciella barbarensis]RIJ24616.1 sodium-dependent bicarbonate transport family permease [Henriciella barbarensis]